MATLKYKEVLVYLKEQIQRGKYNIGDYLPSENELCIQFNITRTTARKALEELQKEGFIVKIRGKGSRVAERRKSLGLLSVKGFSEAVGENVHTEFLQSPIKTTWSDEIQHPLREADKNGKCFFFERLRFVGDSPVMIGKNWFPAAELPGFLDMEFIEGSFFKTLSKKYLIEILGSSSELRAEAADEAVATTLQIKKGAPILHISLFFRTSHKNLNIYSELYCNTNVFPVGNHYNL
jgi:GntR family transcriptional regulator/GntR family frlABCD operon transcriptional regulator